MKQYLVFFLAGILCTAACTGGSKEKAELARLVEEWQGKEIQLPSGMVFTRNVTDTLDWQLPETDFKVFAFVDSTGCVSCKLPLNATHRNRLN
ncbi:MAG: hypothetical protein LBV32_01515 [Tannerellaceae bacterium]|jgi:hypothetical protein|nr:hypothetical protein [Tannerellaceae bacterium]